MQRLRRIAGSRRARWDEHRFVIEGPKLLAEAMASGAAIESVYVDVEASSEHQLLARRAALLGGHRFDLQSGVLARACDAVTPQPIAALVGMVDVPLSTLAASPPFGVLGLGLQDPGNSGTIVRSAAASGAGAVIFSSGSVDLYNPKAVRASAGALFHVPVVVGVDAEEVLDELGRMGLRTLATVARHGENYSDIDLTAPTVLVLGHEASGLPPDILQRCAGRVAVPMRHGVESLNVAMAATVICFEADRQRRAVSTVALGSETS